jgi:predicted O-methyltransferase YrrM
MQLSERLFSVKNIIKQKGIPLKTRLSILLKHYPRHRRDQVEFIRFLTGADEKLITTLIEEIESDSFFLEELEGKYARLFRIYDFLGSASGGTMFGNCVMFYTLVRIHKPQIVVETGGTPGKSSAFILRALEKNELGELYTLDLPPTREVALQNIEQSLHRAVPRGMSSGWIIPDWLRMRHHPVLGSTRDTLKPLLEDLEEIDVFMHDSDHAYDYMRFELQTAYPYIRQGGLLLCDDIQIHTAFADFANLANRPYCVYIERFGGLRKSST